MLEGSILSAEIKLWPNFKDDADEGLKFEAELEITFDTIENRDAFDKLTRPCKLIPGVYARTISYDAPRMQLNLSTIHKEKGVASIPQESIQELLNYLNNNIKTGFDFLTQTKQNKTQYQYGPTYPFYQRILPLTLITTGVVACFFSSVFALGFFAVLYGTQLMLKALKQRALSNFENKVNTQEITAQEKNAFELGVKSNSSFTAQFNSWCEKDAYHLKAYYAGIAAANNDENPSLIKKVLTP